MMFGVILAALSSLTIAASSASWLDSATPKTWNVAGAAIPTAPKVASEDGPTPCVPRAPFAAEDRALAAKGWTLAGPYERYGKTAIVFGEAGHDGMCRPGSYQGFAFYDGHFAGTLSPALMDARAEGSLNTYSGAAFYSEDEFAATFARYGENDPSCCPHATTTVIYKVKPGATGPVLTVQEADTSKSSGG